MEFSKQCPFCESTKFQNNKLLNLPTKDSVLFKNNNIYVEVDISPLFIGHILIITNKHYLNFFETPNRIKKDVIKLKEKLSNIYKEIYNSPILFFEHGSAKCGFAGASIDHAHLHCIPYNFDISSTLDIQFGKPLNYDILSLNSNFKNEFSYIFLDNNVDKKLYKVEKLPSQFLRKIILKKQGCNQYLWQEKCFTNDSKKNFNQTILDLQNKIII